MPQNNTDLLNYSDLYKTALDTLFESLCLESSIDAASTTTSSSSSVLETMSKTDTETKTPIKSDRSYCDSSICHSTNDKDENFAHHCSNDLVKVNAKSISYRQNECKSYATPKRPFREIRNPTETKGKMYEDDFIQFQNTRNSTPVQLSPYSKQLKMAISRLDQLQRRQSENQARKKQPRSSLRV